jgi:hypothetical protein
MYAPAAVPGGEVGDRDQVIEFVFGNASGFGLKVIPSQKHADDVQSDLFDDGEFFAYFARIEVAPPVHGFAAGPVVYAEGELSHGSLRG